ncbi:transposase [Streptomyces decoyicus]|nr:transposase [Streptomyces decoyicus]
MDDRRILNGVVFKSRTGIAWRDLPERYGLGRRSADASGAMSYDHGPSAGALRAEGTGTAEIRLRLRRFSGVSPISKSRTCPNAHAQSANSSTHPPGGTLSHIARRQGPDLSGSTLVRPRLTG